MTRREQAASKPPRLCHCGCGGKPARWAKYLPGHQQSVVSTSVAPEIVQWLSEVGDGSASRGLREVARRAYHAYGRPAAPPAKGSAK